MTDMSVGENKPTLKIGLSIFATDICNTPDPLFTALPRMMQDLTNVQRQTVVACFRLGRPRAIGGRNRKDWS
jgi:hypothetical protein